MNHKVPIFLHIPKNAGTYIVTANQKLLEQNLHKFSKTKSLAKNFLVDINGSTLLRIFCAIDKTTLARIQSFMAYKIDKLNAVIDYEKFLYFVESNDIELFSIVVEPGYFWGHSKFSTNLLPAFSAAFKICSMMGASYLCYTILRPIAERCKSIFSYLNSELSIHEPNHKSITSNSFEEYVDSDELETNWIASSMLGASCVTESQFNIICGLLDKFQVHDISKADQCIHDVFNACFRSINLNIQEKSLNQNKNTNNIPLHNQQLIDKINQKNIWDYRLYKKFT